MYTGESQIYKRKVSKMKTQKIKTLFFAIFLLTSFAVWTLLVKVVDVQRIGPDGSCVCFASLNGFVHGFLGTNFTLYTVTDWLGLVPIGFMLGFAVLGLCQLVKRKHLLKVDKEILLLGIFYIAVLAVFLFFEEFVINYRPVHINGNLEASYPSSTTMLVMCVMPTSAMILKRRINNRVLRNVVVAVIYAFTVFMVTARVISGVHWITDIVGGALVSTGLVELYKAFAIDS